MPHEWGGPLREPRPLTEGPYGEAEKDNEAHLPLMGERFGFYGGPYKTFYGGSYMTFFPSYAGALWKGPLRGSSYESGHKHEAYLHLTEKARPFPGHFRSTLMERSLTGKVPGASLRECEGPEELNWNFCLCVVDKKSF